MKQLDMEALNKWCATTYASLEKLHELAHEHKIDCANVDFLAHAIGIIQRGQASIDSGMALLAEGVRLAHISGSRLQLAGEAFDAIAKPPPIDFDAEEEEQAADEHTAPSIHPAKWSN